MKWKQIHNTPGQKWKCCFGFFFTTIICISLQSYSCTLNLTKQSLHVTVHRICCYEAKQRMPQQEEAHNEPGLSWYWKIAKCGWLKRKGSCGWIITSSTAFPLSPTILLLITCRDRRTGEFKYSQLLLNPTSTTASHSATSLYVRTTLQAGCGSSHSVQSMVDCSPRRSSRIVRCKFQAFVEFTILTEEVKRKTSQLWIVLFNDSLELIIVPLCGGGRVVKSESQVKRSIDRSVKRRNCLESNSARN